MASPRWPSPAQSCACCSRNASAYPPTHASAGKRACKNIAPSAGALACVFILLEPAQRASATITCLQAMLANKAARPCNRVTFAIISAARAGAADASATSAAAFPIRHETPLRRHERPAAQRKPQRFIRISPFTKRKSSSISFSLPKSISYSCGYSFDQGATMPILETPSRKEMPLASDDNTHRARQEHDRYAKKLREAEVEANRRKDCITPQQLNQRLQIAFDKWDI